jgi:hypothetical protein
MVALAPPNRVLAAGIYLVQLAQGTHRATAKVAIVR